MKGTRSFLYLVALVFLIKAENPCNLRATEAGTICVCNSTYCDTVPSVQNLASKQYQLFSTSKEKLGFWATTGSFSNNNYYSDPADATVTIEDITKTHQDIIGFGGAFTDATGINILRLSKEAQELLLESYFGDDGIQYSIGRVPIGGTDFSTKGYTYLDEKDETLESFALQEEDFNYKIPFIQKATELRGPGNLKLFASAWSAPIWMKTNDAYNGVGKIQDGYYGLWAKYYLKFFDAYKENNITFWGVTTQNEPLDGLIGTTVQSNGFTSSDMVRWVKEFIGPTIRNSSYSHLKIILHDELRLTLPILKYLVLSDSEVVQYADGIGLHWYADTFIPASIIQLASCDEKQLFLLATEACTGTVETSGLEKDVELGSWKRAERYLDSIFDDLSFDVAGWIDWNMALNETGGPNWINNEVDAPIIVNGTADEFYKQPMFYALGHFSKFIVPDSVRIDVSTTGDGVTSLAFARPDGKIAVVLRNRADARKAVNVNILGATTALSLEAYSINTLLCEL